MVLSFHRCCVSHLTASKPFSIIALPHYSSSHAQSPVPRPISAAAGTRKRGRCFPTLGRGKTAGAAPSAVPSSIRPTPKPCHLACPKAWTPSVPRPLVQTRVQIYGLHEILGHQINVIPAPSDPNRTLSDWPVQCETLEFDAPTRPFCRNKLPSLPTIPVLVALG